MELVHEKSVAPLFISFLLLFLTITVSFGWTHLVYTQQADINQFYWITERAAGFTAYGLLTLSIWLGLVTKSGVWDRWQLRYVYTQVHQYVGLLFVSFLALHLFGLSQDLKVPFSVRQLVVPFTASYRPIPTGFGILSAYGMFVVILTSALKRYIGTSVWRAFHLISIPVFVLVTLHGLLTGTDSTTSWARLIYLGGIVLFLIALISRMRTRRVPPVQRPS